MLKTPISPKSWSLAALVVCAALPMASAPVPSLALFAGCAVLHVVARPRGWDWLAWAVAWAAVVLALTGPKIELVPSDLEAALNDHCRGMQSVVERLANDEGLRGLFAASGEILDPHMPFDRLDAVAALAPRRTIYLADDRGMVVAWGGASRALPEQTRVLGQREWMLRWSASEVTVILREPVLVEGRMVGAILVADYSPLIAASAFGMRASIGHSFRFGARDGWTLTPLSASRLELPVALSRNRPSQQPGIRWVPAGVMAIIAAYCVPWLGLAALLIYGAAFMADFGLHGEWGIGLAILAAAVALGRLARSAPAWLGRLIVLCGFIAAAALTIVARGPQFGMWLPIRMLAPGWGGLWMLAAAFLVSGWPAKELSLVRRLVTSGLIALVAVVLSLGQLPGELMMAEIPGGDPPALPSRIDLETLLPVAPDQCDLSDLAPVVARNWKLGQRLPPSELRLVDGQGRILSRWGDLDLAGDDVRMARRWELDRLGPGVALELWKAEPPWADLRDWHPLVTHRRGRVSPVAYAVLTRSGEIEATLLQGVQDLDAIHAGQIFHDGGGWALLDVGERPHLARLYRIDDRLVAAIALHLQFSELVVRIAMAVLWALLGLTMAAPPRIRNGQATTFGGRLRLLVGGGVVLPLALLTIFLHFRFVAEEENRERAKGAEALHNARYTAAHLSGGFAIDDDFAEWIAGGLGGEVALFDHVEAVAVSRRDLVSSGVLPGLPPQEAFVSFQLGRDATFATRHAAYLIMAGGVEVQGRRLLLVISRPEPREDVRAPGIVDWLLSGAALTALGALVLTAGIEKRLSSSLRELVAISRKLLHGQPLPEIEAPKETDIAEVLDAVSTMYKEVAGREASLRRQEELLTVALSTLAPAVMVFDEDITVRFANQSAVEIREDHEEVVFARIRALARRCVEEGAAVVETVSPLPGLETTWRIGVASAPLPEGTSGFVGVIDDVTDVVRIDRLKQLNQMARIVAHEVKNPLTPIRLWVQELDEARRRDDQEFGELVSEACSEIGYQVERLQEMANSFSNLAALDRWEPARVDLVALVEDVIGDLGVLARRGIDVDLDVPEKGRCEIVGDLQWLRRALGNIVLNSVTACGDDGGRVLVRVSCDSKQSMIEVEDSGGGVAEDRIDDLFSPHFSTTSSGSGLGLALVHNVVSRCQGSVTAVNGRLGLIVRMEFPAGS